MKENEKEEEEEEKWRRVDSLRSYGVGVSSFGGGPVNYII